MTATALIIIFFIIFSYLGYPFLLFILSKLRPAPLSLKKVSLPKISLLIPVYNEETAITKKLMNSLALDYPPDLYEITVVSDGSTDDTENEVKAFCLQGVRLISLEKNLGKVSAINASWPHLNGEIVVLTDATAEFDPDALKELILPFSDPKVGAVSGQLLLVEEENPEKIRVDAYWKLEKKIRKWESVIGSVVGATGAIWAIRKELFVALPSDTILDDVLLPLATIRAGKRLVFAEKAKAREMKPTTAKSEYRRKVRTLAGNYQAFRQAPWMFHPRSGISGQVLMHKCSRLLIPFLLPLLFIVSFCGPVPLQIFFVVQVLFYLAAGGGWLFSRQEKNIPWLMGIPFAFCLLNAAALHAALIMIFCPQKVRWN